MGQIYFFNEDAITIFLHFKDSKSESYIIDEMQKQDDSWWFSEIQPDILEFKFIDETGYEYNLGGTMGEYPENPSENFKTSCDKIWVKDGIIYDYNPDKPKPDNELVVLNLNLHCYQEDENELRFYKIAEAIYKLDPDIVTLQEGAQHKDTEIFGLHREVIVRTDNSVKKIVDILKSEYGLEYDWFWDIVHYAWKVWDEGISILSKTKLNNVKSKYISRDQTIEFCHSRKIVMIETEIPGIGNVKAFSCHMGWWKDEKEPFEDQFDNLVKWLEDEKKDTDAVLICGDFNVPAGTEGYEYIKENSGFIDSYYVANPNGFEDPTIGNDIDGWGWKRVCSTKKNIRIDYGFLEGNSNIKVSLAQRIFTEKSFGRVSDHNGIYYRFTK